MARKYRALQIIIKVKKLVNPGYLDYVTLAKRQPDNKQPKYILERGTMV